MISGGRGGGLNWELGDFVFEWMFICKKKIEMYYFLKIFVCMKSIY